MQNLPTPFAFARGHVFAHLPIHRRLQTVLDRQRAALDKKVTFQRRQTDHAFERLDKFRVVLRVNVRVGDFDLCRTKEIALHRGIVEVWMIESDRHRAEKSVEIDEPFICDGVVQVRSSTFVEIHYDLEAIEQDMLLDCFEDFRWRYSPATAGFFALCGAASIPRCAGRLREFATANLSCGGHGWCTHC